MALIATLHHFVRAAHITLLRFRLDQMRSAAIKARQCVRDVYEMRNPSVHQRLAAMDACSDACNFESKAEALRLELSRLGVK